MEVKSSNLSIQYTPPPVQAESTVNFRSFADVRVSNLRTFSGDINRVKLYSRNKDAFGDFELIADTPIESPELLYDNFSVAASQRTGYFITQNMINTYWSSGSGDTLTRDSSIMLDSMKISGSNYGKKSYALAEYTSSIDFIENTTYNFRGRIVGVGASSEEKKSADYQYTLAVLDFLQITSMVQRWVGKWKLPMVNLGIIPTRVMADLILG